MKKKLIVAYISTILVLAAQTIDTFFVHDEAYLFGGDVFPRLVGIAVLSVASFMLHFNVKNFCFRRYGWPFEVIIGILYAAVPVGICYAGEYAVLKYVKGYSNVTLNVAFPNVNDNMSSRGALLAMGVFVFAVLLEAVFKELFFRGFLITQFFQKYGINKSVYVQAFLYTLMSVPIILQMWQSGRFEGYGWKMALFIVGCTLSLDFISGVKWGLFYRVNGTVWMSVADHFSNHMLLTCVFITRGMMPMKWVFVEAVAVQVISFALFIPLYFRRDRQNEEIAVEVAIRRELAGLHVDNYSPSPLRRYTETKRLEKAAEFAKKRNLPPPKPEVRFPKDFEEAVSLNDSEFFSSIIAAEKEEKQVSSTDIPVDEKTDAKKENPTEQSMEFFEKETKKSLNTDVDITAAMPEEKAKETDDISGNGDSITKLVQGFYEENFNKHTF